MPENYELTTMQVAGFADSLSDEMVPTTVVPVFRSKTIADAYLLPPFRIEGTKLLGATRVDQDEFQHFIAAREITEIDAAFPAQPDYLLWIDIKQQARYEPQAEVLLQLQQFAREYMNTAQEALQNGTLAESQKWARHAIATGMCEISAYALLAAIARHEGDEALFGLWEQLKGRCSDKTFFDHWVQIFSRELASAKSEEASHSRTVMRGCALARA